ncbi:hypothetical protein BS17DRAFT_837000, partial [Gyrodon lividus]
FVHSVTQKRLRIIPLSVSHSRCHPPSPKIAERRNSAKEFTVSTISEPFVEVASVTSVEAPVDVNEWELSGLTMARSISILEFEVKPPWVKESAVGLVCELFHTYDIRPPGTGKIPHTLGLGLIKRVHVRESVLADN